MEFFALAIKVGKFSHRDISCAISRRQMLD
jgi:hypothetical protein